MDKLEKLTQDEFGTLHRSDSRVLRPEYAFLRGKISTLVVANPCFDISSVIDEMATMNSASIPSGANAYVASDFSGDTQHLRKNGDGHEKLYSVFAVQFYYV